MYVWRVEYDWVDHGALGWTELSFQGSKKQQNEMKLLEWTLKKRNKVETGFGKTKWKQISQSSEETVGDS